MIRYIRTKRGGTIFTDVFALVLGVIAAPSLFPGLDIPVWIWVALAAYLLGMNHLLSWFMWQFVHPKPWIERRKNPIPLSSPAGGVRARHDD